MSAADAVRFVDARQVRRGFARVASQYEHSAFLAREVDRRMLDRLDYVRIEPKRILDLGCATGASLTALRERYRDAALLGADFCLPMLQAGRRQKTLLARLMPFLKPQAAQLVAADAERLPLKPGSLGLIWSNLLLHWLDEPRPAFREAHRTLEVGGLFMFSTFGPDTLRELAAAFGDGDAHTQRFTDMHDLGDMLVECGFADPVMDMEVLTLTYASVDDLVRELRAAGETCAMAGRRRGLAGRGVWERVRAAYAKLAQDGRLPATFEVVYGHAWKGEPKQTADGRAIVRFEPRKKPA
ncbi:malonyl-ACP O-methyltransferase BioC [Azospira restricta]|uniref:Malonyl-[acyl-carrier protein] O-methyltransferase n=1 Tax=Azospira restricta TaxID=404405 RepID=A0A974Y557_9RHOO|nr:malonyl-ACP O-methyltransferase BioC [Azospira restricta]QRJ65103.1 malonyl-ACP O-methyltransferase BioC [Azospira restricta]